MATPVTNVITQATSWTIDPAWPSTSFDALWHYDEQSSYVNASVVSISGNTATYVIAGDVEQTLTVDNDNTVYAGARTQDSTTTYWICDHSGSGVDVPRDDDKTPLTRGCTATTAEDAERPDVTEATSWVSECWWAKRQVLAVVTGEPNAMYSQAPYEEPEMLLSEMVDYVNGYGSAVCSIDFTNTAATISVPEETSTTAGSAGTPTGDDAEPTNTEEGASSRMSFSTMLMAALVVSVGTASLV